VSHPFGELSPWRRSLGAALRRLRTAAGLSGEQIAERTGLSQSRVSRIELGQQSVPVAVVETWARAAGAEGEDLAAVIELAEAAATQTSSWRGRGLARLQYDSRQAEASTTAILNYQPLGIPGLLQVPEYSRRLIAAGYPRRGPEEVAAAVKARMDRQVIVYDEGRHFEFVMGAAALYWRPGPPALMRAQLDRLSAVTALDNVTIGIIPLGTEVPGAWCDHSFNILDGPDPIVHVETLTTPVNVTDPADIEAYRDVFRQLQAASVTGEDARKVIAEASRTL
jgi:transcriptional regulator with XRE-family HTH domain